MDTQTTLSHFALQNAVVTDPIREKLRAEGVRPAMEAIVKALSAGKPVAFIPAEGEAHLAVDQVNWPDAFPYCPDVKVSVSHDNEAIRLRYEVSGLDLRARFSEDHGEVWTDSCCEFFCRPFGEKAYQNYEINCIGAMTASRREERKVGVVKYTPEDMARIGRKTALPREIFEDKTGEQHWWVEMQIPFSLILGQTDAEWRAAGCPIPSLLEANLYKCGDRTAHPHFVSWAPISVAAPDFHRPEYFGLLVLA